MANTGKTVATLLIGAAVGAAVGYVLATDSDKRSETIDKLKDRLADLQGSVKDKFSDVQGAVKDRFGKKSQDLEQEIYNA